MPPNGRPRIGTKLSLVIRDSLIVEIDNVASAHDMNRSEVVRMLLRLGMRELHRQHHGRNEWKADPL